MNIAYSTSYGEQIHQASQMIMLLLSFGAVSMLAVFSWAQLSI